MVRLALESDYYHAAQIEIERVSIFISRLEHISALLPSFFHQMRQHGRLCMDRNWKICKRRLSPKFSTLRLTVTRPYPMPQTQVCRTQVCRTQV